MDELGCSARDPQAMTTDGGEVPQGAIPVEVAEAFVHVRTLTWAEERTHPVLAVENAGKLPPVLWSTDAPRVLTPQQIDARRESLRRFKATLREVIFEHYGVASVEACVAFELAYRYGYPKGVRGVVQHFEDFLQLFPAELTAPRGAAAVATERASGHRD